jgi:putative membrane protein
LERTPATAAHFERHAFNFICDGMVMNRSTSGMRAVLAFAALFVIAAGSGHAAAGGPGTAESAQFLQKAMLASMAEVELGELAQRNAASTGINALGTRLARDHRRIGKVLGLISQDRGMVVPASLDGDQQALVHALSLKTGVEFDAAYAERMVISHESLIALFDEAAAGADADVAAFAKKALPMLREGKRLAEVYRQVTSRHRPQAEPQTQTVAATG